MWQSGGKWLKTPHSKQVHHPSCLHMHPNKTKPCIACPCPPSMENTSKSGHTHGDTLTRYTSYTYTGTISTVSIGSSTLPYSNFNNIVFQKKINNIELRPLARGFLQSFASCSSWSLLQAAAAACSWAWDTAAVRPLATTAPEAEHSNVWLSPWQL